MNRVALKLNIDFISKVEEEPTFELDSQDKIDQWKRFKKQSFGFYTLMADQGNQFYLNHKVDKRGRAYAYGYHITTQGTAFKKAMLEFANEEIVEGVL
jgi:DNA-directed RNA polymerase